MSRNCCATQWQHPCDERTSTAQKKRPADVPAELLLVGEENWTAAAW